MPEKQLNFFCDCPQPRILQAHVKTVEKENQ